MLSLSRKSSESIIITVDGKTIEVIITNIRGNQVKLGINAPSEVKITRSELLN